jgi:hypothetical protein
MSEAALSVIESKQGVGALYRQATDVAGVCGEIVRKTAQTIGGRKYVRVEGWQSIAVSYGCVAGARDVERIEGGVRALGEVRRMSDGQLISTAEGFVGDDEPTWAKRPEYARRAMAQTRAISRACRSAFAFVVTLIDSSLSTTPAEEVPDGGFADSPSTVVADRTAAIKAILGQPRTVEQPKASPPRAQAPSGMNFPNYGKAKGQPVAGASERDLQFYRSGCVKTLEDPAKAKWHDRERALLAAINAELEKLHGPAQMPESDGPPPHSDEDAPF